MMRQWTQRIAGLMVWLVAGACSGIAADQVWESKKDKDGIRVEVRKVSGSSILEYKGTVVVKADPESVVRLFEDDKQMPKWFYQCAEARLIEVKPPREKVFYFVFSMPWPVRDRDLVFRSLRSEDPDTGAVEYRTSALPGFYPQQTDKIRMPYLKGLWRFTPLPDGRTEIHYQQHSEIGGMIPGWLVNKLAVNIPFNSLSGFRKLLSEE